MHGSCADHDPASDPVHVPRPVIAEGNTSPIERCCSPCHFRQDIMRRVYDRKQGEATVKRMNEHPDIVPAEKIGSVVDELVKRSR